MTVHYVLSADLKKVMNAIEQDVIPVNGDHVVIKDKRYVVDQRIFDPELDRCYVLLKHFL